jgi:opacity protein-like surface antigen
MAVQQPGRARVFVALCSGACVFAFAGLSHADYIHQVEQVNQLEQLDQVAQSGRTDRPEPLVAAVEPEGLIGGVRAFWHGGTSRLEAALKDARHKVRSGSPDWLRRRSGTDPLALRRGREGADTQLIVQEDRVDGTELLTVRYAIDGEGALRAYAGAGLNRAEYFVDGVEPGPAMMTGRNRRSSLGAAAEVGAELRVSEHMSLSADLRWVDLDDRANALRSDYGPVSADPVLLGISVGYRFR